MSNATNKTRLMDNQQIITVIFSLGFLVIGAVLGIVGAYEPVHVIVTAFLFGVLGALVSFLKPYHFFILGALVMVNMISTEFFTRADLTANKMYSLSDSSKDLMRSLDDQVIAKVYLTAELPPPYNQHSQFIKDLLEEYQAYSSGKFRFEIIDPGGDEQVKQELTMLGVPPVQINKLDRDEFQMIQVYLGIVFYYGTKKEVIPVVRGSRQLEYEITSTVRKLIAEKLRTVAFMTGFGAPTAEQTQNVRDNLATNYKIIDVDLSKDDPTIPDDAETLIVAAPKEKLTDDALFQIDQFLMKGRTVAFLLDNVNVNLQTFQGQDLDHGLYDMVSGYGITMGKDLVLDLQNKRITMQQNRGPMQLQTIVAYPYIPVVTEFNRDMTLTKDADGLSFPFISSLELAASTDTRQIEWFMKSSQSSWQEKGFYQINPMNPLQPAAGAKEGPFILGATATGIFTSYFANRQDATVSGSNPWQSPDALKESVSEGRIMVIADGSFVQNDFLDRPNFIFFANVVDWLMADEALISIRSRDGGISPIEQVEDSTKLAVKWGNALGVPLVFILFGIMLWQLRRSRRDGVKKLVK